MTSISLPRTRNEPGALWYRDVLNFLLSILGIYGLLYYLRLLVPRNLLPQVSAALTEAEQLLDRAETTSAIPQPNGYRSALTSYEIVVPLPIDRHLTDQHSCANEFLQIRRECHRAPGLLRQCWLANRFHLSFRLKRLLPRVEAIKRKIEVCWKSFLLLIP